MQFKDIFARPIDRHMDSVIKSDDAQFLASELEEYVLTPEVRRSLQRFCDEYNDPKSSGNGAWISGFYGSGKSHLLKMLSHMLENEEVDGRPALDYMKPKLQNDAMLMGALAKACEQTPSESILFNVGGKSDSQRRDTGESLLNAFIKVLNEKCGYFAGEHAHVAMMERDLDNAGLYLRFKEEVESGTGRAWEIIRKNPLLFGSQVSKAYDRATGQPEGTTGNVFEYYAKSYHPTPEDFANWVWDYIQKRDKDQPGFRLNFFADEMGQYIDDSVPLLQMLQDIAENLNTKCRRRAWIVVVSQEEMQSMSDRLQANSAAGQFSKIQARFKVLVKIPANDSTTVVKERLLEKQPNALSALDKLYEEHSGEFSIKLDFPDGAMHYKPYNDREDFVVTYPLVGYQFTLFHQALTGLSSHEAFTGQYVSTGARNMLGTTHRVLVSRMNEGAVENGDLIPFDAMFEGLRDELKSEMFGAVSRAEEHFDDKLGVRVLKALLLVKYIEGFKATPTNLAVLLYDGFGCDQVALREHVRKVCLELASQTYIRRNGDAFEYLTNDEKDVESEIKREQVSQDQVSQQIGKLISEVIGQNKVKYVNENFSCTYAFDILVDNIAASAQRNELKVNFLTALTPSAGANFKFSPQKTLSVALPSDSRLVQDVFLWLQTNIYIGLNQHAEGRRASIVSEKKAANEELRRELLDELRNEMNGALWGTAMQDVTDKVKGSGTDRVVSAVKIMISAAYPHLRMLHDSFDKKDVYRAATGDKFLEGETLPEYCTEVINCVNVIRASSSQCVVGGSALNSLEAKMRGGDYGWPVGAVRQAVAILAVNDKLECLRYDEPLEGVALAGALSQGDHLDTVEVRPAIGASQEQLSALVSAYRELTGMDVHIQDAKTLANNLIEYLAEKLAATKADNSIQHLPFAENYRKRASELEVFASHKRDWFIQNIAANKQAIRECIDDIDAMRGFANGKPGEIFADARNFLSSQAANIAAVPSSGVQAEEMRQILNDSECYKSSSAPRVKGFMKTVAASVDEELSRARKKANDDLLSFSMSFRAGNEYRSASDDAKRSADRLINSCSESIKVEQQIVTLRGAVESFKATKSADLYELVAPVQPQPDHNGNGNDSLAPKVITVPLSKALPIKFRNRTLSTSDEVEAFANALREELLNRVANSEKIIL